MGRPLSRWRKRLKEGSGADDLPKHLAGKLTHGIIEEPMLSPLIPLAALIELRKFLDSLHTAQADCQRKSQFQGAGSADTTAPLGSKASARRRIPQARKSIDEFNFFQ